MGKFAGDIMSGHHVWVVACSMLATVALIVVFAGPNQKNRSHLSISYKQGLVNIGDKPKTFLMADDEEALEPGFNIFDPHHHMGPTFVSEGRPIMCQDLMDIINDSNHNVEATAYIQADQMYNEYVPEASKPVGEVEYAQGCAAMANSKRYGPCRLCGAIQGAPDLEDASFKEVVAEMQRMPNFSGIRIPYHQLSKNPGMLEDPSDQFKQSVAHLEQEGLVLDIYSTDIGLLPKIKALAKQFSNLTIVLDHMGGAVGPYYPDWTKAWWKSMLSEIAEECPNVFLKVGGMELLPILGWGPELTNTSAPPSAEAVAKAQYEWMSDAIDCFTPKRCMFESNFPMGLFHGVSYRKQWNIFKLVAKWKGLSTAEKNAMFHDTAAKVYAKN